MMEILEANGFTTGKYQVVNAYPNTSNVTIFPTIAVDKIGTYKKPVEIGGKNHTVVNVTIDVFANSDGQRDDLSDLIQESLDSRVFTLYDFTNQFPVAVGNYSGIPSIGDMYISRVTVVNIQPQDFSNIPAEKYHDMIMVDVVLPSA